MGFCIATDEAGYGPRLGPLVISAAVWEWSEGIALEAIYERLSGLIAPQRQPSRDRRNISADFAPLVIGDSKAVFDRRLGPCSLERTVLTMLAAAGKSARDWTELIRQLAFDELSRRSALGWYADHWPPVPERLSPEEIAVLAEWLRTGMADRGVRLLNVQSVLLFPERFNRLLAQYRNKATLLSCETLNLVKGLLRQVHQDSAKRQGEKDVAPVHVFCDKHGGRDHYAMLLSEVFSTAFFHRSVWVQTLQENRRESIYRVELDSGPVEFHFVCGGESLMPVALASMVSKYVRELAMAAWNGFWTRHLPGLAPTAGYPEDARRFYEAIADRKKELGIPDTAIWRMR